MSSEEYSNDGSASADGDRRLVDFPPGARFKDAVFAIADKQMRKASNGTFYLATKLRDCTGERNAKLWNAPPDILQTLDAAPLVRVSGHVDPRPAYRGDFVLQTCEPQPEPADLTPFLTCLPTDHVAHRARFSEIVRSVKEPNLHALLKEIFRHDGAIWPRFETAPAAKSMHHAHRGGLLEHSGEVALLCDRVASTLPHLDRDLLVTAALLHDIGKLEEMESDLHMGEYTSAGHLVGHVVLGTCSVAAAAESIPDFPAHLKHELMHLILSHHGRLEHGAARVPICAEAVVLSLCDLMSAKVAQCREKASADGSGEFAGRNESFGWESERIYLGAMKRMLAVEEAPA
jgi:3'-5' exoribonuclease